MNQLEQKKICIKYNAEFLESSLDEKLGIALNVKNNKSPITGLKHKPVLEHMVKDLE